MEKDPNSGSVGVHEATEKEKDHLSSLGFTLIPATPRVETLAKSPHVVNIPQIPLQAIDNPNEPTAVASSESLGSNRSPMLSPLAASSAGSSLASSAFASTASLSDQIIHSDDYKVMCEDQAKRIKELESKLHDLQKQTETEKVNRLKTMEFSSPQTQPARGHRRGASASFFSGKSYKIEVDFRHVEVHEPLSANTTAGVPRLHTVSVSGFTCACKEISTHGVEPRTKTAFERELDMLEVIPAHHTAARYLFHDSLDSSIKVYTSGGHKTLADLIAEKQQKNETFSLDIVTQFFLEIAKGLEYIHSRDLVHQNLYPENILVTYYPSGDYKLITANYDTSPNFLWKSPKARPYAEYLAPEVFNNEASLKSDVWSLGMILYELLTMRKPFAEQTDKATIPDMIIKGRRPCVSPNQLQPRFIPFITAYEQCTEYYPDERPSLQVLKDAILECAQGRIPAAIDPIAKKKFKGKDSQAGFNLGWTLNNERSGLMFEKFLIVGTALNWKPESGSENPKPSILYEYPHSETPTSQEILDFCFPAGIKLTRSRAGSMTDLHAHLFNPLESLESPQFSFSFLVWVADTPLFGICVYNFDLINAEPAFFTKTIGGGLRDQYESKTSQYCAVVGPRCYCFLSRFPFFKLHYDVLYSLLARERLYNVNKHFESQEELPATTSKPAKSFFFKSADTADLAKVDAPAVKHPPMKRKESVTVDAAGQILYAYYHTPVPKRGESLSFKLPGELRSLEFFCPPGNEERFIYSWCIASLCRTLPVDAIVTILELILLENSVAFTGTRIGVLSNVVMSLISLLRPYVWQGTFLPIITQRLGELLESPVPFILGVTAETLAHVTIGSDVVIVNIDDKKITQPPTVKLPELPMKFELIASLKPHWEGIQLQGPNCSPLHFFKQTPEQQKAVNAFVHEIRNWHSQIFDTISQNIPSDSFDFSEAAQVESMFSKSAKNSKVLMKNRDFFQQLFQTQQFQMMTDQLLMERSGKSTTPAISGSLSSSHAGILDSVQKRSFFS